MIILQNGNYVHCECARCGSKLGVHEGDIRYDDMAHRGPTFGAACGACGATVAIPQTAIPRDWIDRLVPSDH